MPESPDKKNQENPQDDPMDTPQDRENAKLSDSIDELELEPISAALPGERSAKALPEKGANPMSREDHAKAPYRDADDVDIDDQYPADHDFDGVVGETKKPAGGKSGRRMFPGETDADPLAKRETGSTPPPESAEKTEAQPWMESEEESPAMQEPPGEDSAHASEIPSTPGPGKEAPSAVSDEKSGNKNRGKGVNGMEKLALTILAALVIALAVLYLPKMLPETRLNGGIAMEAKVPLKTESMTISRLDARWVNTTGIVSQVRRGVEWTPELEIELSASTSGALRIFFHDENDRQRGDTIDVAFANGAFTTVASSSIKVYCTNGFPSEFGLKDIKARGNAYWSARVLVGPNVKAASSEFKELIKLRIPFEISTSRGNH